MTRRPFMIGLATPSRMAMKLLWIGSWRVRRCHNDNGFARGAG